MHVVVLGDSIAAGMGAKDLGYVDLLRDWAGSTTAIAGSAMQLGESKGLLLPRLEELHPDAIVVAHGITEAIIRPTSDALRWMPRRWRRLGWMDPRPYYSRRPGKRIAQRLESEMRWRVKAALIRVAGGCTLTSASDFCANLEVCLREVLGRTRAAVVVLSHPGLDERYFPGSMRSLDTYWRGARCVVESFAGTARVRACDISQLLDRWGDYCHDHFHPNATGHAKIAAAIMHTLSY